MKRSTLAGGATAVVLVLAALAAGRRARVVREVEPAVAPSAAPAPSAATAPSAACQGFLFGRVETVDGATYEGRLRWGGDQEAFWSDTFNGYKRDNPWAAEVPPERLPKVRRSLRIFGVEIAHWERPIGLNRPFTARFGDITRLAASGREVRVTLKSGTELGLDRSDSSDFDDGVRVWDEQRGVIDLDSLRIRSIQLLPTVASGDVPTRLHGTVRTRRGEFTGFVEWNRNKGVGADELSGYDSNAPVRVRFDALRSIAVRSRDSVLLTLADGSERVLSDSRDVDHDNRGIFVDDRRYGRVLVSREAFERVDFGDPGRDGSGPAYGDFPPGRPLAGRVVARGGRKLAGRLVFDLDESETTDTLDAPFQGVNYSIPFGLVAAIVPPGPDAPAAEPARVTLRSGEELQLERAGDLGEGNAGVLVFVAGGERPEYVRWTDVERVDFEPPPP